MSHLAIHGQCTPFILGHPLTAVCHATASGVDVGRDAAKGMQCGLGVREGGREACSRRTGPLPFLYDNLHVYLIIL